MNYYIAQILGVFVTVGVILTLHFSDTETPINGYRIAENEKNNEKSDSFYGL